MLFCKNETSLLFNLKFELCCETDEEDEIEEKRRSKESRT
jgi:hypothetical protein